MSNIVMAVQSATIVGRRGEKISVRRGEAWSSDSVVVQSHPDLFSSDAGDALGVHLEGLPAELVERGEEPAEPDAGSDGEPSEPGAGDGEPAEAATEPEAEEQPAPRRRRSRAVASADETRAED